MKKTLTIQLDGDLERLLDRVCRRSKRMRCDVVREALRRHLSLLMFQQLRHRAIPFAEARQYLTDEDIFRAVS